MGIESPIDDISSLNEAWPLDTDLQKFADDHLRLTKDAIKKQFTSLSSVGGIVTVTATEMNYLSGLTANIQDQLDSVGTNWQYTTSAAISAKAGEKFLINPPVGGTTVTLPAAPTNGVEIQISDASGAAAPPNNTITISRSGSDTITNITKGTTGQSSFSFDANGQHYYFVYYNTIWYAWAISGWI